MLNLKVEREKIYKHKTVVISSCITSTKLNTLIPILMKKSAFIYIYKVKNGTYGVHLAAATSYILSLIYPTKNNGTCIAPILQFLLVFPFAVDDLFELFVIMDYGLNPY